MLSPYLARADQTQVPDLDLCVAIVASDRTSAAPAEHVDVIGDLDFAEKVADADEVVSDATGRGSGTEL